MCVCARAPARASVRACACVRGGGGEGDSTEHSHKPVFLLCTLVRHMDSPKNLSFSDLENGSLSGSCL